MTNIGTPIGSAPKVTILMGVCNGGRHLAAQLNSISGQTHSNWHLICSDDASTDASPDILRAFSGRWPGQVTISQGPQTGFSDNYMSLIGQLPPDAGYICFADQDDIWLPDKISRALLALDACGVTPTMYCARQSYWYPREDRQICSPRMIRPFTLQNALVENVATGNTIMLNPQAAAIARQATRQVGSVFAHDWWLYLLLTATGGSIHFDNGPPAILYRQHTRNAIGAGQGLLAQIRRKTGVLRGLFSQRIDGNLAALEAVEELLTPNARAIFRRFAAARRQSGFARLAALRRISPYRQHPVGTLGFWGAASLGRV